MHAPEQPALLARRIHRQWCRVQRLSRPQTAKVSSAPRHGLLMIDSHTRLGANWHWLSLAEPAAAVPAIVGHQQMAVQHAQEQTAFLQRGPSPAQEPGSASGVDTHQHLMSMMQPLPQQQQVSPMAQQQQQAWAGAPPSHVQGQQQQPQQQPQAQRAMQQRQLLVRLGLISGLHTACVRIMCCNML